MNKVYEHIKEQLRKNKITQDVAAERLGVSRQTVNNRLKESEVDLNFVKDVKTKLDINVPQELLSEEREGGMRGDLIKQTRLVYDAEHHPNHHGVPYLGDVDVFAGKINLTIFNDYKEYITDWFDLAGFRGCDCFINVSGDSMEGKYSDKDVIGIMKRTDWSILDYGKPHIFVTDEVPLFKFLHVSKKPNHWQLRPGNKDDYDTFDIPMSKVRALFFVKGKIQIKLS